ncbi:MAG: class I SAM-dependent methyltransferase [Thermoplasmata archaeon]
MRFSWRVDPEARAICWRSMMTAPREMVRGRLFSLILDLGSSNGAFGRLTSMGKGRIVGVDISPQVPLTEGVEFVQADILHLPFKDESFDLITARAILHHVPKDLDAAVNEACRVLRPGHVLLNQEPTSDNCLSELARRLFRTVLHDPSERTFSSERLRDVISGSLTILEVRYHLVLTYLLPHIASRLRGLWREMLLGLSRLLLRVDESLLARGTFWRRRAAYVTVMAEKPQTQSLSP